MGLVRVGLVRVGGVMRTLERSLSSEYRVSGVMRCPVRSLSSEYCARSHACGELGLAEVGRTVTVAGWVQARRVDRFLLVRDRTGVCQVGSHRLLGGNLASCR